MRYLLKTKFNQVVLWVDQNEKKDALLDYKVSSVNDILKVDFDYVVIAVMNAELVKDIKESLIVQGIDENKIATMDATVMTEESIPDEIKKIAVN
jgi:hypothetical protein